MTGMEFAAYLFAALAILFTAVYGTVTVRRGIRQRKWLKATNELQERIGSVGFSFASRHEAEVVMHFIKVGDPQSALDVLNARRVAREHADR